MHCPDCENELSILLKDDKKIRYNCTNCDLVFDDFKEIQAKENDNFMYALCIDNSHTWRNVLTLSKRYEVLRLFNDPYAGYEMVEIKCDDGEIRPYRANRFNLV
jgi:hypothetical protein